MRARIVVAKATCEELMTLRTHHFRSSSIVWTAQDPMFLVLHDYHQRFEGTFHVT